MEKINKKIKNKKTKKLKIKKLMDFLNSRKVLRVVSQKPVIFYF